MIRSNFNYDNAEFTIPFLYKNNTAEPEPVNIRFLLNDAVDTPKEVRYLFPINNDQKFNLVVKGYMVHRFFELFNKPMLLQSRLREFKSLWELDVMQLSRLDDFRIDWLSNHVLKKVHLELETDAALSSKADQFKKYIYTSPARNGGTYGRIGSMDNNQIFIFEGMTLDEFTESYATATALSIVDNIPSDICLASSVPLYYYDYYSLNAMSSYVLYTYDENTLLDMDGNEMNAFMFEGSIDGMQLQEFNIYTPYYRTQSIDTYTGHLLPDVDWMAMSDFILT